jgi:hypothetical protein
MMTITMHYDQYRNTAVYYTLRTEGMNYYTLSAWLTSALASSSNVTTDAWPSSAANKRAVAPT